MLALLFYSQAVLAQNATPKLPDPAGLDSNWWDYFIVDIKADPQALAVRIQSVEEKLEKVRAAIPRNQTEKLTPLFESLILRFAAYGKLKAAPPSSDPPATIPAQAYSVEEILELADTLRKVRLEHQIEAEQVKRLEKALKNEQAEQTRRKLAYLELSDTAPDRLEQGLLLMQSRVQLEIASEQLKRRKVQRDQLARRLSELDKELSIAFERTKVDAGRIPFWEEQQRKASTKLNALNRQLTRLQIDQSSALTNSPIEKAQAQLATQKIVLLETQAAHQQVLLAKAEWAVVGIRQILSGKDRDTKADRELYRKHLEKIAEIVERKQDWHRTTSLSRAAASENLGTTKDAALFTMHESRLVVADETEQALRRLDEELDTTARLGELLDRLLTKHEGRLGQGVQLAEDAAEKTWETIKKLLTTSLFEIGETPVTSLGLFRFMFIVFVAWLISKLLRRGLQRVVQRRETVSRASVYTLGQVLHYFILTMAVVVGLSSIGVDFTKFALIASALGIGIGFGLQNLVSNFVAGLIILFEKSLKAGDFVELESGVSGEVKEINMRSTLITTNDNVDILVPNSEFVNGRVTNWTMREVYRRVHIPFGVAYGTDKDLVRKSALAAADAVPWTLKGNKTREPQVWFVEFGDSSLNFELVVWLIPEAVKRPSAVQAAYLWEIESQLKQAGIEIPFPQRDLHLRSVFGKKDEDAWPLIEPMTDKV